jgi:hypothetical protein
MNITSSDCANGSAAKGERYHIGHVRKGERQHKTRAQDNEEGEKKTMQVESKDVRRARMIIARMIYTHNANICTHVRGEIKRRSARLG